MTRRALHPKMKHSLNQSVIERNARRLRELQFVECKPTPLFIPEIPVQQTIIKDQSKKTEKRCVALLLDETATISFD